ncbi:alpha-amylase family glycosyl hydrolase [Actinoallomurus rhizosphaericola]|uniref:alpha-amylase family glycosyl hydrolase n=1 Tax=Actinoallomurus rhizosphaericola TaxID=2952536 RepID=UPI0020922068|nr:alpha-amylase family glycosyl hydrolase [Actinoallomurus rhizosphaericola]MCO5997631.1 alpha-amylase family glycosyl hydrolase [Actinoallomurus rhizosphaericola]
MRNSVRTALAAAAATLGVAAWSTALPANAAPASAGPRGGALHSLRGPVTNENFYFVMADRFKNGDTANDTGGLGNDPLVSGFDPTNKGFYNGGDLKGITSKLDYIQGLGTNAIWLTPSFKNKAVQLEDGPSAGYHGYWITDFTQIDPHLGTNADLAALVKAAHQRGMKVYFDIITNHTADVIGYKEGGRTAYVSKDAKPYRTADGKPFDDRDYAGTSTFPKLDPNTSFPYTPVLDDSEKHLKVPDWLNDVTLYHNRGNTTFTGEDAQYGDFYGLDDLMTENPRVVRGFMDIYETWIRDFGIDGFRIDTMKHVNDEFWQTFGPGIVKYAREHGKPDFFMFGEVALDGSDDAAKSLTSHYTTHDKMQAVLDFPFQDAARSFASRGRGNAALARFFAGDDWYTDADSNVYELPTFLGNHDMGRIGYFLTSDNPGASDAELVARDRLAHELMYFSRGNPVVYYGDEQGFTGKGGDQLARQTMFASKVPEYLQDHLLGTASTHAVDNFNPDHPLYRTISDLAAVTKRHPALRNGAEQVRYASDGPGVFAFSRMDRTQQREYVVALNNATTAQSAAIPTYLANGGFTKVYGTGTATLRSRADRTLQVTVPALSAVVYLADGRVPASKAAPAVTLATPAPAEASHGRMHVAANVAGSSFNEVTFQVKVGDGPWQSIGTDDSAPYQVFHDTSGYRTGTPLRYRAVVLDNAGHTRWSRERSTAVPAPAVTVTAPKDGGTVTNIDPVTVQADVDPERATESVRFERSVGGGTWEDLGTDTSSPAYTVTDDVSKLPLGTQVRYRATLLERGSQPVTGAPVTVTTAAPKPARDHVTLVGSLQSEAGCGGDWDPACAATRLAFDTADGQWHGTFTLPAGDYEWKIAINDSWTENYGAGGASGGENLKLSVPADGTKYRFTWNQVTHVPSVEKVS